jgi:hypothetical protein
MKKNTPLKFLAAAFAISGLTLVGSCVKTDNVTCASSSESPVVKVTGSDTAFVNEADTLTLSFLVSSSCGKSAAINPSVATQSSIVHVVTAYEGCTCTQAIFQVNKKYVFKSPNAGNYTLSFWGGNDTTVISKTIHVQ